jgi:general secretion pathway protein C
LFKPAVRPVAAPPPASRPAIGLEAALGLFGGNASIAVASNFQLKGVIVAKAAQESVALLSADGKPAQAIAIGAEVAPGVTVKEVHAQYVLLSESGVIKRVELPESAKGQASVDVASRAPLPMPAAPPAPPATLPAPVLSVMPEAMTRPRPAPEVGTPPPAADVRN